MRFKEKLKEELRNKLMEEELSLLPRGFQTIGHTIILKLNPKLLEKKKLIGEKCLEMLPGVKSIFLNLGKITGKFRIPENVEFLTGEDNPIVEHKEHGIIYKFDITKIMFSKGNLKERKHLATLVRNDEIIVDMFAGIGYFSLPIARHSKPKKIYSIEFNPFAYKFFIENIKLNHLEERIIPILGNSKTEVLKLSDLGINTDRVIMGILPAPKDFIKEALTLTRSEGTIYHYEGVVKKENIMDLFDEFNIIAVKENYTCELIDSRLIKSFGPALYHAVLDIFVSRG